MTTLTVTADTDYSADLLSGIDLIAFTTGAEAIFSAAQFDNVAILDDVLIEGFGLIDTITVNGGSVDASQWLFGFWPDVHIIALNGTSLSDTITGSSENDTLTGKGGADTLTGGAGDDIIKGGAGRDTIEGGTGNNTLTGGAHDDIFLFAREGFFDGTFFTFTDTIDGGQGTRDRIVVGGLFLGDSLTGCDISNIEILEFSSQGLAHLDGGVFGPDGISKIIGPAGALNGALLLEGGDVDLSEVQFVNWANTDDFANDSIHINGTISADTLIGSAYEDFIEASWGDDVIDGGDGDDTILPDRGEDTIDGGAGNDVVFYTAGDQLQDGEWIDGGAGGGDAITLQGFSTDRDFDLTDVIVSGVEALEVLNSGGNSDPITVRLPSSFFYISAVQHVTFTIETVLLIDTDVVDLSSVTFDGAEAASASTLITGISSSDVLTGGSIIDIIIGGSDVDVMTGNAGNDVFRFNAATEMLSGEFMDGGTDTDTIELSASLTGLADFSGVIIQSVERLEMLGSGQKVILSAGQIAALTEVEGSAGQQSLRVTADTIDLSALAFTRWAGSDNLRLTGTADIDSIIGSSERDIIISLEGDDTIDAGAGDDDITGGLGRDLMTGGDGADHFIYETLDDTPTGDTRDRIRDFTQGEDLIVIEVPGFTFIEDNAFSGNGTAEISFQVVGATTTLNLDGDGDGTAESKIALVGAFTITDADLILL